MLINFIAVGSAVIVGSSSLLPFHATSSKQSDLDYDRSAKVRIAQNLDKYHTALRNKIFKDKGGSIRLTTGIVAQTTKTYCSPAPDVNEYLISINSGDVFGASSGRGCVHRVKFDAGLTDNTTVYYYLR
jgi:hypothetical protein